MNENQVSFPIIVSAALMVVGSLITAFFNWLNKRDDAREKKRPSIQEVWDRMDKMQDRIETLEARIEEESKARNRAETFLRNIIDLFMRYVSRVQNAGDTGLTDGEKTALADAQKVVA